MSGWIWWEGPALLTKASCSAPFKIEHPEPSYYSQFGAIAPTRDGLLAVPDRKPPRAVRVYSLQSRQQVAKIFPPNGYAEFGLAAATGGGRVAVTCITDNTYVNVYEGEKLAYSLPNPTKASNSGYPIGFASHIDMDGDYVVAGCPLASNFTGTAVLYNVHSPQKPITLQQPKPAANDWFGAAVAIDGSTVAVGAPRRKVKTPRGGLTVTGGAVYLFDLEGNLIRTIENPAPRDNDIWWLSFGGCLALRNGVLALGAPSDSVSKMQNSGVVYVYDTTDDKTPQTLTSPAPADWAYFGLQIAIGKSFIAVSSCDRQMSVSPQNIETTSGAVALFGTGKDKELLCLLKNPSPNKANAFSASSGLGADGTTLVVGAWGEDVYNKATSSTAHYAGAVYLYDVDAGYVVLGANAAEMLWPVSPIPNPGPQAQRGPG